MLIIANPPYGVIGSNILKTTLSLEEGESLSWLEPVSDLRKYELYKYVVCTGSSFPDVFEDANTDPFLWKLSNKIKNNKSWKYFCSYFKYDERFLEYYKWNIEHEEPFKYHCWETKESWEKLFKENRTFLLTLRTCQDGVSKGVSDSLDRNWNLKKVISFDKKDRGAFGTFEKKNKKYAAQGYEFQTELEKENICRWWYSSKMATSICKGLKCHGFGRYYLPRIDWSENREYTDEYVLNKMGLRFKNKDDVEEGFCKLVVS